VLHTKKEPPQEPAQSIDMKRAGNEGKLAGNHKTKSWLGHAVKKVNHAGRATQLETGDTEGERIAGGKGELIQRSALRGKVPGGRRRSMEGGHPRPTRVRPEKEKTDLSGTELERRRTEEGEENLLELGGLEERIDRRKGILNHPPLGRKASRILQTVGRGKKSSHAC